METIHDYEPDEPQPKHTVEPVNVTAVGEIKRDRDGEPYIAWIIEGGAYELPDGVVLLVADKTVTDDNGHGAVVRVAQEN